MSGLLWYLLARSDKHPIPSLGLPACRKWTRGPGTLSEKLLTSGSARVPASDWRHRLYNLVGSTFPSQTLRIFKGDRARQSIIHDPNSPVQALCTGLIYFKSVPNTSVIPSQNPRPPQPQIPSPTEAHLASHSFLLSRTFPRPWRRPPEGNASQ